MASRREAVEFLSAFKMTIQMGQCLWKGQPKTEQGLIDLSLTRVDALSTINGLTAENYHSGPAPDDTDPSKMVWVFGCQCDCTEVYVKLRLTEDPKGRAVTRGLIWSFHPAERPLTYPLKAPPRGGKP